MEEWVLLFDLLYSYLKQCHETWKVLQKLKGRPNYLTQAQQVDQKEVLEGNQGEEYTSIDNDNLYAEPRQLKQGQYLYPVIFEPVKNIRLSISSYQVTTFVDLSPYFQYFEEYERYLNNFRIDLADRSRMSYLAKYHHDAGKLRHQYPQTELDRIDCERQEFCNEISNKPMCHRLVFQFCMTQRQYYQITNATKHLHTTFLSLKNRFLGIIDYWDETLQSVTVQQGNTTRKKRHSTPGTVPLKAKNQIVHDMDVLAAAVEWIEKKRWNPQQPQDVWVAPEKLEMGQIITREEKGVHRYSRKKRNPLVWAGLGWGVYSNKRQIDKIKKNIRKLQDQNILQAKQIDELARYMNLTMERVRQHDQKLYELEVELVQLRSSLVSLSYDFDYTVIINYLLRNAQTAVHRLMIGLIAAQYNVDRILEYLRAMATHQCSPVLISPPALRRLLRKVKDRITPNPRLKLPYHIDKDIWKFYDVLKVTPVVLDKLLVILLTIPLTNQSLEMNLYRVHNLPLTAPDLHMTAIYSLEGEYLAIGKKGMYVAIPDRESIQICIMSELGLCTMKTALYPADMVEWCLYALFQENDKKIDQYCKYQFKQTDSNYATSLGGFMWAISAVITEKLQVRCLTETHVVDIRPPVEIVYIGNGCEGYSPHLFIPARSTLTSEINIFEREQYFLKFNLKYRADSKIGVWAKLKFRLQSKEEARKEVQKWAELQPMTMEYLGQKLDLIDTENYPFELPTKALLLLLIIVTLIIVTGLVIALVKWWKGRKGSREIKNMLKLMQIKDRMRYFFPQTNLPENKASHHVREPVVPTAPIDHGTPRRKSLGSLPDLELELVKPQTQVQVHALPKASQSAPKQNLADEEQLTLPTHHKFQRPALAHIQVDDEPIDPPHHNLQKDGEPVQTLIRQIVKDAETADRYAKYVNRKSKEELDKPEPLDGPNHGVPST